MIDLRTSYLGLELKNPLVPSASPLSRDLDSAKKLEDAGASALVLHSLFEESIRAADEDKLLFMQEQAGDSGAVSLFRNDLDDYLEHIQRLRQSLDIPLIASLNGISRQGWIEHASQLQQAGADALELNVYYVASNPHESGAEVEQRYIDLLRELRQHISIPLTMKITSQFSSVGHFVGSLQQAGADGVALFNRFYQPGINLFTREFEPAISLSSGYESLLRINWVAALYGKVDLSLAVTGGIHSAADVLRALMAGADVTHLCSVLLRNGPQHLAVILQEMLGLMHEYEYEAVSQIKGSVRRDSAATAEDSDRASYVKLMQTYLGNPGIWR